MNQAWKQWEGQVIDGKFLLSRYLGGNDHTAVFLTESDSQELQKAVIKLMPAEPQTAEFQLARWERAAQLSHPHLIRLFQTGSCQLDAKELLYVVMEYAEDDLSRLLASRPLTPTDSRELLAVVLDTFAYVHDKGFVYGRLKSSDIMSVNGRPKISSDGLVRIGESLFDWEKPSLYDPPEIADGHASPAGDVWSLGIVLVEALTQHPLAWGELHGGEPQVPETVPMPFRDFAAQCLYRAPQRRWTVADFWAALTDAPPPVSRQTAIHSEQGVASKRRYIAPALAGGVLLAGLLLAPRLFNGQPESPSPATARDHPIGQTGPGEKTPAATQQEGEASSLVNVPVPGRVASQILPTVPQSARDTIQGTVRVAVRVRVDPNGSVTAAEIESPGPSRYFARLALQASRLWEFISPKVNRQDVQSEWILRFGFTKNATEVDPVQVIP